MRSSKQLLANADIFVDAAISILIGRMTYIPFRIMIYSSFLCVRGFGYPSNISAEILVYYEKLTLQLSHLRGHSEIDWHEDG